MNHDKDNDDFWSAISRIEVSVKNSQEDIRRLYLHSARHEIAIESLDNKVEKLFDLQNKHFDLQSKRFDQQDKRFDQQDRRFDQQDRRFDQQDKELREFKQETRERFDQLELLIRQLIPNN